MSGASVFQPFFIPLVTNGKKSFQAKYKHTIKKEEHLNKFLSESKTGILYKKLDGRYRREERAETDKYAEINEIIIYNPLKQEGYFLDTETQTAFTLPMSDSSTQTENDSAQFWGGRKIGKQIIEGFVCQGYRIGEHTDNFTEYWVAEDIPEIILAKNIQEYQEAELMLFDIKFNEPNDELFIIPSNYTKISLNE